MNTHAATHTDKAQYETAKAKTVRITSLTTYEIYVPLLKDLLWKMWRSLYKRDLIKIYQYMLTGRHSIASVSTFSLPISFHPHLVAVSEMAVNNLIFGSDGEAETAQRKSSQTWPPFRIKGVCDRRDLVNLVASSIYQDLPLLCHSPTGGGPLPPFGRWDRVDVSRFHRSGLRELFAFSRILPLRPYCINGPTGVLRNYK